MSFLEAWQTLRSRSSFHINPKKVVEMWTVSNISVLSGRSKIFWPAAFQS